MNARLRYAVIVVVTTVWAANFIASLAVPGYTPQESINGIFMVIVGGLYGADKLAERWEREKQEKNGDDDPPTKNKGRKEPSKPEIDEDERSAYEEWKERERRAQWDASHPRGADRLPRTQDDVSPSSGNSSHKVVELHPENVDRDEGRGAT